MAAFDRVIIRVELYPDEVALDGKFVQVVTGKPPAMYKGAQMEVQCGIFKRKATTSTPAELYDISQFTGLPKLRIRDTSSAGIVLLDETVADSVAKDPSLDLATWQDGSKQHFRFIFAETVTGIAVGNGHFFVIYGPDGDVFGISSIAVIDPGTGIGASPTPPLETYYTKTEVNGKLLDKMDKVLADNQPVTFYATNSVGARVRITLQPVWDDSGARLVPLVEFL